MQVGLPDLRGDKIQSRVNPRVMDAAQVLGDHPSRLGALRRAPQAVVQE